MANFVFNIAKGRFIELYNRVKSNDPADSALVVVLLKTAEADSALKDYDDLAALLAGSSVEADFTNYARKVLTDSDLASLPAPDDGNDRLDIDLPDQTYTSAGGASDNTLVKVLVCYDGDTGGGTDSNIIPMLAFDVSATTDGNDYTFEFNASGAGRAQEAA
jgi:hypothetical protein